jgi:hypothetical protein
MKGKIGERDGVNGEKGDGLGVGPFKVLAKSVLRSLCGLILFKPEIPFYIYAIGLHSPRIHTLLCICHTHFNYALPW